MFKRKKLIVPIIGALFLLILVGSYMINPQPVHVMMVSFSDMKEYDDKVYVESSISEGTIKSVLSDLEQAKGNILQIFEDIKASPTLIFVHSSEAVQHYAQKNLTGQTYYMYWGSYIVIGPQGFNKDVIAHELMHAELRKRLKNKDKVPVWFDEGFATLVESRYVSDKNVISANLEDLSSESTFYDPTRVKDNYKRANDEITRWYGIVGNSGLYELIDGLNAGQSFANLYQRIEERNGKL